MWYKKPEQTRLDIALDRCYDELEKCDPASDRYQSIAQNAVELNMLNPKKGEDKINKNTVLTVAVYASLTLVLAGLELFGHSLTSRAMSSMAFKPKL